jgi:hypothetical protein
MAVRLDNKLETNDERETSSFRKARFSVKDAKTEFWIAGGCFIGIVTGSKIKDIDVFAPDPSAVIAEFKERCGFRGCRSAFRTDADQFYGCSSER